MASEQALASVGPAPAPAMTTALVLPAGGAPRYATRAGGPKILGFTPLERTVFSLAKAGVRRVCFVGAVPDGLATSPVARRLGGLSLGVLAADAAAAGDRVLVVAEGAVFDPRLPLEARDAAPPDAAVVSVVGDDGAWAGLGWVSATLLLRLEGGEPFPALAASVPAATVATGGRYAVLSGAPGGPRAARRALLQSVRKDTDGFVARTFNRPLSQQLTRAFIALGLTPNQISVIGLLVGLAGAAVTLRGNYWALLVGAALYQLASVLDGSDGEVAKLTGRASAFGSWVDTVCDEVASVAYFVALPVGLYRGTGNAIYLALGAFSLVALGLLYVILIAYLRRTSSQGSMLQVLADVREASGRPGLRGAVSRLMLRLSFIVRRDFFSFMVLLVCLVGLGGVAVWTIAAVLVTAMAFLIWFTAVARPRPAAHPQPG